MSQRLAGKTALITAAGQGIGRATAELFVAEGANVIATDINVASLQGLSGCKVMQLDVTSPAAVESLAKAVGGIDVLFNCAGIVPGGTVMENSEEEWRLVFDINVYSVVRVTRALLPGMIARGGGSIVNMASVASSIKGLINRCAYGASKAAVIGLTKSIAADFVSQGIRCNAVCPGTVDTPSLHQRWKDSGDYEGARKAFVARQPMARIGKPNEIAELVLYLASDAGAFVSGQAVAIDGGITI